MASGEDARGWGVSTGPCILGRNRRQAHHLLHETLLRTSPEGCIQKEGEGCSITCDHLCGQHHHVGSQPRCLGSICMAPRSGHAMEMEQYSYCYGQAIDLGPLLPVTQFRVTDEVGTYLCAAWALVFEGSILVYNSARDEAEWVPACSTTNDLSWVEEKSAVALANFVPRIPQEAARTAMLRARHLMSWPNDSSLQEEEEEDEQEEEEEVEQEEGEEHEEVEEQGKVGPELLSGGTEHKQSEMEQEAESYRR